MILWQALVVFVILFAVVLVIGLLSYRFLGGGEESAEDEMSEWGLGGRRFGTIITWFLVGGDLYTAYTLIAVPGLVFGLGAIGFFALPYTIIVYPLVLLIMPKLWQIAHNRGMVTPSDYVKERFDSPFLALLIAITGFAATMPYIALKMYGIEIVVAMMGIPVTGSLIVAFAVVALFTFVSGLRAPALIALVKDTLIILTIIVAVVYIAYQLGGFDNIFAQVPQARQTLAPEQYAGFATLALGSALALFLYPHAITAIFGSSSQRVIRRNASLLPAYTIILGLVALFGYMALAAGTQPTVRGADGVVPQLFADFFADPIVGFAFAAIAIGAVVWVLSAPNYAITLQRAGGVWILQTLPAVFLALYVGWLDRWAVVVGWLVGMVWGTYGVIQGGFGNGGLAPPAPLGFSTPLYVGFYALAANLVIVFVGSAVARFFLSQEQKSYGMLTEEEREEPERA